MGTGVYPRRWRQRPSMHGRHLGFWGSGAATGSAPTVHDHSRCRPPGALPNGRQALGLATTHRGGLRFRRPGAVAPDAARGQRILGGGGPEPAVSAMDVVAWAT